MPGSGRLRGRPPDNRRVQSLYDRYAPRYDRSAGFWERVLHVPDGRRWIGSRAEGDVLEMGAGTGRNFPFYPGTVRLTAIDLSPGMIRVARLRAEELGLTVDVRMGDAARLDFAGDRFDTVVFGLCLCTIPDDRGAIDEARRVLRPGGRLLALEHVASDRTTVRLVQRLIDPLAVRFQADHLTRDPLPLLERAGFRTEEVERNSLGLVERISARKPSPGSSPDA